MDTSEIMISSKEISQMVKRVAAEINRDYKDEELIVIPILTGAFVFAADLVRELKMPVNIDFMQVSSYVGDSSTGVLKIKKDLSADIKDQNVLIVEDIIDTGRTLNLLKEMLLKKEPKSLRICTAFDKPDRRIVDLKPDYNGIVIPDKFIVGYGLDYDQKYRNLPCIGVLKPDIYS